MKRVLAIDGGGLRGIIPAQFCRAFENWVGRPVNELFDLIVGTSTGGIIALALSRARKGEPKHISADRTRQLYLEHGPAIFARARRLRQIATCKYTGDALHNVLDEFFGDSRLAEAAVPVIVTTYDISRRRPHIMKSEQARRYDEDNYLMADAARATAAAPTYFPVIQIGSRRLVDGGIFSNNPSMVAYAEARRMWGADEELLLVSLGTGTFERPVPIPNGAGLYAWKDHLLDCVFDGISDSTDYVLKQLLGRSYVRLQGGLPENVALDDCSQRSIELLLKVADDVVSNRAMEISSLMTVLSR